MKLYLSLLPLALFLFGSCAPSVPSISKQESLHGMVESTVKKLEKKHPSLRKDIESAEGYLVADMKVTKVPVFGAGGGTGVIYTKGSDEEVFLKVVRADLGAGYGARSFKVLIVFNDVEQLEKAKNGFWNYEVGAEVTAGNVSVEGGSESIGKEAYQIYYLTDLGASATFTARLVRLSTVSVKPSKDPS